VSPPDQFSLSPDNADAPNRWHNRSLSLLTAGENVTGMQLAHHPVRADPQAAFDWRCDEPVVTTFDGSVACRLAGTPPMARALARVTSRTWAWRTSTSTTSALKAYEELLSRTALPVGVRKGMVDSVGNGHAGPVVLGPNTCMDLPADVSFEFVVIRARSLAEHRAWLQILDDTMRRDALIPSKNRGAARTEMEISLTASQSYALLQAMAIQKASLFSTLL